MRISATLVALAVAAPLGAQRVPESLPVPLVTALLYAGRPASARTTFTVGELPAGWPSELTLPGRAVVGGMTDGRTRVTIFADTTPPIAEFFSRLRDAGYTQPRPRGQSGFVGGGGPYSYYCRDSATVSAATAPAPAGLAYLRVTYTSGGRTSCTVAELPPASHSTAMLELPELPPPAGLRAYSSGSGLSNDEVSSNARLEGTSVTPAELISHYARLLTAAGWTSSAPTSDAQAAAQIFAARDKEGHAWRGVLSVFATATGREARLAMHREETP